MKPPAVIVKMLAIIVGMGLLCAGLLSVVAAEVLRRTPEQFRVSGQMFHELSLSMEDKKRMLAEDIAQLPAVKSADVANLEARPTRIQVVTTSYPSADELEGISSKCINHGILVSLDNLQRVICTVSTGDGTSLATYESGS